MTYSYVKKYPNRYTKLFRKELLKNNYSQKEVEGMTLLELYEEVKYSLPESFYFIESYKEKNLKKVSVPYSALNPGKGFKVRFSMNGKERTARFLTMEKAEKYIEYLSTKNVESISNILSEEDIEKY